MARLIAKLVAEVAQGLEVERVFSLTEQLDEEREDALPVGIEIPHVEYRVDGLGGVAFVPGRLLKGLKGRVDHSFGVMTPVIQKAVGEGVAR